jgi:hypothetical protein
LRAFELRANTEEQVLAAERGGKLHAERHAVRVMCERQRERGLPGDVEDARHHGVLARVARHGLEIRDVEQPEWRRGLRDGRGQEEVVLVEERSEAVRRTFECLQRDDELATEETLRVVVDHSRERLEVVVTQGAAELGQAVVDSGDGRHAEERAQHEKDFLHRVRGSRRHDGVAQVAEQ